MTKTPNISVGIIGVGKSVPKKVIKNDDLIKMGLDTSDEWIFERTGIKQRHIASENESTSDFAYLAALEAIESAQIKKEDIDLIIVATSSPDHLAFPATACIIQEKLGLRHIAAFDISAACTGFTTALTTGTSFIQSNLAKNALIIGADCLSKLINWEDRSTCILFGDGAGAVVLSEVPSNFGILSSTLHSDGSAAPLLGIPCGGTKKPFSQEVLDNKEYFIEMDGRAVFKKAVQELVPCIKNNLQKVGLSTNDINFFIPHQANVRIIDYAREKLKLDKNQVYINIEKYGNTSAASIPIALCEAYEKKLLSPGHILVLAGFGAGFMWGSNIIKWSKL